MIRQKVEPQNGDHKKTKQAKFSQNENFLPPDTHTYVCFCGHLLIDSHNSVDQSSVLMFFNLFHAIGLFLYL